MLSRDDVVAWVGRTYGPDDAEERVRDAGYAFWVRGDLDREQDGQQVLVLKRTGEFWHVGAGPDCLGVRNATSENELRRAMKDAHLDPRHPFGTVPATAQPPVTRPQVVSWLARRHGWRHLDDRVTDLGWMFLVNGQPDEHLDGERPQDQTAGPIVVVKASGAVWWLPWAPELVSALGAPNEQEFQEAMASAGYPLSADGPHDRLVPPAAPRPEVTRERVVEWLATSRGWRHTDRRITDLGWAFSVNTQPDEYLDGDSSAMTIGNGPMIIVKRTGAIWALSSRPEMIPVFSAASEQEFNKLMIDALPLFDGDRPTGGWLPTE